METGMYKKMEVSLGDVSFEDKYMVGMLSLSKEPKDVRIGVETINGFNKKFHMRYATSDGHTITGFVTEEELEYYHKVMVAKHN